MKSKVSGVSTDIIRIELESGLTKAYMSDGDFMPLVNTIDELEKEFGDVFIRVHPCHLVNHRFLKSINSGDKPLVFLNTGDILPADTRLLNRRCWWKRIFNVV